MAKDRILMCSPDFFAVEYAINPWMDGNEGNLSLELAKQQRAGLRDIIEEHAEVVLIEPQAEVPDMVFTANAGTVLGNKAIASHFMPMERRAEEKYFKQWFHENGFELYPLDEKIGFEGAGDSLFDRGGDWLWVGYGFRTEIEAHPHLQKFFAIEVVSIRLVDPRFYHIDTCFCPLSGGWLMYHPPAFDEESQKKIIERVPADKRIVVSSEDAGRFACNSVNIGDKVIMNRVSESLRSDLAKAGFEVIEASLTEFLKAGGSAKCLTLKLIEPSA
ncbi:MAG: dimethylarginine dimethylaminohydrolase family protein [Gammaproteobacteria bacterium]|nr:dimethylarginine dimethylaminohydrolase family protein [Gammaproteobacteria bacterium]